MTRPLLLAAAVLAVPSVALAARDSRTVPAFDALHASAGIHVTVTIGPQEPVQVEADADVLPHVQTVVEDGALQVRFESGSFFGERWSRGKVEVKVQTPALSALGASGGAQITAAALPGEKLRLQASGGARIEASQLDARNIEAQASGGARLQLAGKAAALELELSGGAHADAAGLAAGRVSVQGSGGAWAEVDASDSVTGNLSGGSHVRQRGKGATSVTASGGSRVESAG